MKKKSVAVVIVSNGPGELATWVRPVVDELHKINQFLNDKLARFKIPTHYWLADDSLPRGATDKLDRIKTRKLCLDNKIKSLL